jgi:hypothetical protein
MIVFLNVLLRYVVPFMMGVGLAAATILDDTASVIALIGAGSFWFFTRVMPKRQ